MNMMVMMMKDDREQFMAAPYGNNYYDHQNQYQNQYQNQNVNKK